MIVQMTFMRAARVCVPRVIMVWFYGFLLLDLVGFLCFRYLKEYFQFSVRVWLDLGNKTTWSDLGHKTTRSDFDIDKTWLGFGKDHGVDPVDNSGFTFSFTWVRSSNDHQK